MSEEQQHLENAENASMPISEEMASAIHPQTKDSQRSSEVSRDSEAAASENPQTEEVRSERTLSETESNDGLSADRPTDERKPSTRKVNDRKPGKSNDRTKNKRPGKRADARPPRAPFRGFTKFAVVLWSGQREPADNMYWAEAQREGDWVVFKSLEPVRTRREIMERLLEMEAGLVGFDFPFSYPGPFLEMLRTDKIAEDWRQLAKKVREDLKKNSDDGIRAWIERMGKYRESALESDEEAQMWRDRKNFRRSDDRDQRSRDQRGGRFGGDRFGNDRFARDRRPEPVPAHEKRSFAERFRRTDLPLRRSIEPYVAPIMIAYNKLTSRYEFSDTTSRGRAALLGLSMFDQLLEAKPELSIWPMMRPGKLTLVEVQTALFAGQKPKPAEEIRKAIDVYEDGGWEIPANVRDLAARNPEAQRAFLTVIGMIRTENREDRINRPMRDYQDLFYDDPQVHEEGWIYGVGYRHPDQPKREEKNSKREEKNSKREEKNSERDESRAKSGKNERRSGTKPNQPQAVEARAAETPAGATPSGETQTGGTGKGERPETEQVENPIVMEPPAEVTDAIVTETAADIHAAASNGYAVAAPVDAASASDSSI